MRILLLAEGDPETWDSWSGSSRSLVRALRSLGHQVIGTDVSAGQLGTWADRAGAHLVRGNEGGDPAAVSRSCLTGSASGEGYVY